MAQPPRSAIADAILDAARITRGGHRTPVRGAGAGTGAGFVAATQVNLGNRTPRGFAIVRRVPTAVRREQIRRAAAQIPAGLAEITVANSSMEGGYRPAIVDQPGAIVGLIQTLVGSEPSPDSWSGASMVRAQLASQRTNEALGIANPRNLGELALRVGPSLVIPSRAVTAPVTAAGRGVRGAAVAGQLGSTVARLAPPALDAIQAIRTGIATRIAAATTGASSTVGRAAQLTGRGALNAGRLLGQVMVPLRQGGKAEIAVGASLAGGLTEYLDNQEGGLPNYHGISDMLAGRETQEEPEATELDLLEYAATKDLPDSAFVDPNDLDALEQMAQQPEAIDEAQDEADNHRWRDAAVGIAAAVGGGGIALRMRARRLARANIETPIDVNAPVEFVGQAARRGRANPARRAQAAIVQADQPIRDVVREFLGRNHARAIGYRLDRVNNVAMGGRMRDFVLTGRMPGTNQRSVRLAPLGQAIARRSSDEQRAIGDALVAATTLDDIRRTGVHAGLRTTRDGTPITVSNLEATVRAVTSNPELAQLYRAIQQSYRDMAIFRQQRGMDTPENVQQMFHDRPNYVPLNRNMRESAARASEGSYDANADRGFSGARSEVEGGGVNPLEGVANPIVTLWSDWAGAMRRAELNDIRAQVLQDLEATGATVGFGTNRNQRLIQRVDRGNRNADNVHTVWINGKQQSFQVNDPDVARALHLGPRQTIASLEQMRQFSQSMTTGPLATLFNGFAAMVSPVYDTTMSMALRPAGVRMGAINEVLSKIHPSLNIGALDPTIILSSATGGLRYLWDDIRGSMSTAVGSHLYQQNSWLRDLVGDRGLQRLNDLIEGSYEASIRSEMDQLGISSQTMHGSPDHSQLLTGVDNIAPDFAKATTRLMDESIIRSAQAGDMGPLEASLAASQNAFTRLRASGIARAYGGVLESLHNGMRYQTYAANRSRATARAAAGDNTALDRLASEMRRLGVDSAQHGSNAMLNRAAGSFMYANLGIQSLYEVARRALKQPLTFAHNYMHVGLTMAALSYVAMANDHEALERHRAMTPAQRARGRVTFEGGTIPLDPVARLMYAPAFAVLDELMGANEGEFNFDLAEALNNFLEGNLDNNPEFDATMSQTLHDAIAANNPFQPEGQMIITTAMAHMGIDPAQSRMSGQAVIDRSQSISGLDPDQPRVDSLLNSYWERMIASLFSSVGRSTVAMADDAYRAFNAPVDNSNPNMPGPLARAFSAALDTYVEGAARSAGPWRGLIFGDRPSVEGVTDVNWLQHRDARAGIDKAINVMQRDVNTPGMTGRNRRTAEMMPQEQGIVPQSVRGTELEVIASLTSVMQNRILRTFDGQYSTVSQQAEGVRNGYLTPQRERTLQLNELTERRRYINMQRMAVIRRYEQLISERLGRPFRYDDFDPNEYMNPVTPAQ